MPAGVTGRVVIRVLLLSIATLSHITYSEARRQSPPTAANSAWPPPGVYQGGRDGVTVPVVVREVKPDYTADALRAGIEGNVIVECVVRVDGTVGPVRVVHSLDRVFGLDDEAVKAAKQWRFGPARKGNTAVPVLVTLELLFTVRHGSASSSSTNSVQPTTPNKVAREAAREPGDLTDAEQTPEPAPLNDWKTAKAGMKAEIGGDVLRMSKGEGWIRTRNEFLDFVFRVRYRVMTDDAEGAVLLRAWKEPGKDWPTAGYRIAINGPKGKTPHLLLTGISERTSETRAGTADVLPPPLKGQWRVMEATCERDRVTVRIDGRQVADIEGREPNAGVIGIEARKGTIEYQGMSLAPTGPTLRISRELSARVPSALAKAAVSQPELPLVLGLDSASTIRRPTKLKDVRPRYPEDAQKAGIQGVVILEALISSEGRVTELRVLQSVDHDLDIEAVAAVRRWEFTPTIVKGVAVPVIMTVTVTFSLE